MILLQPSVGERGREKACEKVGEEEREEKKSRQEIEERERERDFSQCPKSLHCSKLNCTFQANHAQFIFVLFLTLLEFGDSLLLI